MHRGWIPASTRRKAVIYGPDGDSHDDEHSSSSLAWLEESSSSTMVETVSAKCMPSLAKVACGFAPDGHEFRLQDIETVHVLEVDESHIELSAVLCENRGCVTVAVGVDFPHSCAGSVDDVLELCIIENLNELDGIATNKIRSMEWMEDNEEELLARGRLEKALTQKDNIEYPSWWVQPGSSSISEMPVECETIRSLLNEDDFQQEIRALSTKIIGGTTDAAFTVGKAGVAIVGPVGLILRAQAKHEGTLSEDDAVVLELPVRFAAQANSVDELRALVLELVDEVGIE